MEIGAFSFQPIVPLKVRHGKAADADAKEAKHEETEANHTVRQANRKVMSMLQALQAHAQDTKVRYLLDKFKNGKKLTPAEMAYLRAKAPDQAQRIERITREREAFERSMKIAPTKQDVRLAALYASHEVLKHENAEERFARAMHLNDAQLEYMKTEDYRNKPDTPFDRNEKKARKPSGVGLIPARTTTVALVAYQRAKHGNLGMGSVNTSAYTSS